MEIKVESGIPVPQERPNFLKILKSLNVNDSFRVERNYWSSLRNAASNMNKRSDKHFVVRKVKEPPTPKSKTIEEFIRVWRES